MSTTNFKNLIEMNTEEKESKHVKMLTIYGSIIDEAFTRAHYTDSCNFFQWLFIKMKADGEKKCF